MNTLDTLDTILTRRSTRNYLPKLVEKDKLDKILLAGQFAPCGSNTQTNHFFCRAKGRYSAKTHLLSRISLCYYGSN